MHIFQILTSATMEVTCAATRRSVRTPWEATAACVPGVTDLREWAFPAWVSRLGTFALPHNLFSENRRRLRKCLNLSGSHPSPCVRTYCNSFSFQTSTSVSSRPTLAPTSAATSPAPSGACARLEPCCSGTGARARGWREAWPSATAPE